MASGFTDHGSEQYGQFDLRRLNEALTNGTVLDPSEVYIVPSGPKAAYSDIHLNIPSVWKDAIDRVVDDTKVYPDRSYFIREAIAIRLSWYAADNEPSGHPLAIRAQMESDRLMRESIDEMIRDTKTVMFSRNYDPDVLRSRLMGMLDYCKRRKWGPFTEEIRSILAQLPPYGLE